MANIIIDETKGNRIGYQSKVIAHQTSDDQHIAIIAGDVEITLHITEALELSSALENHVQHSIKCIEEQLIIIESVERESTTAAALESAAHNALRNMITNDWKNATSLEYPWVWNDLQYTLRGNSQAIKFYDLGDELAEELESLISVALERKFMAEDAE